MILLGLILIFAAALVFALGTFRHASTVALVLLALGALLVAADALDLTAADAGDGD